ncbi:MAG: DUF4926 domain-containing protein [Blastocatellia bacterium]|nr:DUF4926 domain-containing protein [Blastocatellia bacterium]
MLETRKAQELDVVELTEDLPEYGLNRGQRGAVITAFDDPCEAYDLEFVDESGESQFAYSVRPEQIININVLAKEIFERGIDLLNRGSQLEAEREFQRAIELIPSYIGVLHNSIVKSSEGSNDWEEGIEIMRFVLRIDPQYKPARDNLAIAFLNLGVQKAKEDDINEACLLYYRALGVESSQEIVSDIRKNLAAAYTFLGLQSHESGQFEEARGRMLRAFEIAPNENTRHNLGLAYAFSGGFFLDQDELEKSIWLFESAEDAGLVTPKLLNDYGVALARSNRLDEAIRAFERALELAPENKDIQANLELAKSNAVTGFNRGQLSAEFYPPPPMQSQDYVAA